MSLFQRMSLKNFSRLVALPHSVFALPFAMSAYFLALRKGQLVDSFSSLGAFGEPARIALVVFAVVCARTAAMSFNRLIDAEIDSRNPRTVDREIPAGRISLHSCRILTILSVALFLIAALLLGKHCFVLSPFVLAVLLGYSYAKRYTSYSHLVLGLALALAPGGAWWVLRPEVELAPLVLMAGVLCWVTGFDILYSCQDVLFDRRQGLFSIPAAVGVEQALVLSTQFHVLGLCCFFAVGQFLSLGGQYSVAMAVFGAVLLGQHLLISPHDLRRVNQAFFVANGSLSIFYFLAILSLR